MTAEPSRPTPPPAPPRISPLPFAGMIGLACVLFLDLGSAEVLRWWAVVLLVVAWLALFVAGLRLVDAPPAPAARGSAGVGLVLWVLVVVGVNLASG